MIWRSLQDNKQGWASQYIHWGLNIIIHEPLIRSSLPFSNQADSSYGICKHQRHNDSRVSGYPPSSKGHLCLSRAFQFFINNPKVEICAGNIDRWIRTWLLARIPVGQMWSVWGHRTRRAQIIDLLEPRRDMPVMLTLIAWLFLSLFKEFRVKGWASCS